jgi:phosphohistidine phosphatase SixA
MKLYLMRHGHSISPEPGKPKALSERGEKDAKAMGKALKKRNAAPAAIWHSPLPRAIQTAELVAEQLKFPAEEMREKKELVPEGNATFTLREVYEQTQDLLIVSHLPFLKSLMSHFADYDAHPEAFDFPTAGVAALEVGKGNAKLLWTLHPKD